MAIFGTIGWFVKNIDLGRSEIALYRALLACVLLGGYFLASKKNPFKNIRRALPLLLLSGAAMGFNWILLFEAYRYTTVSTATLCYYFAPVLVMILCPVLFKERLTGKQILCFVISTASLVLITVSGRASSGSDSLRGILLGLGAAVLYAFVVILNKFITDVDGIRRTFLQFIAAAVTLLPYVALTGGFHFTSLDNVGLICMLVVGLVHTGATYCMYFSSLATLPGQEVAILSYIDPLVAVLVSVLLLSEPMSALQYAGGACLLGATLWNELS